jgi:hypothetical protein
MVRGLGDAGASARNVWVPGQRPGFSPKGNYSVVPKLSAYGGVPNDYSQSLYAKWQSVRAAWKGKRGWQGPGNYSQGGVFFGVIDGKRGFFARPKRTKAFGGKALTRAQKKFQQSFELRQRGADGKFISTGRDTPQERQTHARRRSRRQPRRADPAAGVGHADQTPPSYLSAQSGINRLGAPRSRRRVRDKKQRDP